MSEYSIKEQKSREQETATKADAVGTPLVEEQVVKQPVETTRALESMAIGNQQIIILKHDIYRKCRDDGTEEIGIEMVVENVSDAVIGSVLFEAVLYDIEGNVLDTVGLKTVELKPSASRNLRINYQGPKSDKVKGYCVRVAKTTLTPEPKAIGNERIMVLKHSLLLANEGERCSESGIELAIRNASGVTIASATFEALFYDVEGNVLDTVKHTEDELRPDTSRGIRIYCSEGIDYALKSYSVRLTRVTLADVEKVQLRGNRIRTTETKEEEVEGSVKNISSVKTDAALVATFLDSKSENIGTRVIVLRDIEPNNIRPFRLLFKPQEGDKVEKYTLNIGELVESVK